MTIELPELSVAVNVPEPEYDHLNGFNDGEITIEFSLDGDIVVIAAWPNDGERVDRDTLIQTLEMATAAIPQILDQMEAQPSE